MLHTSTHFDKKAKQPALSRKARKDKATHNSTQHNYRNPKRSYNQKESCKVRKKVKIRNRCNQVQHLTQDTIWKSHKKHEKTSHTRQPTGSAVPSKCIKAARKTAVWQSQKQITNKFHKKKQFLGMICKKITGGLKLVSQYKPHP